MTCQDCDELAVFGFRKVPTHCVIHYKAGMIVAGDYHCHADGCELFPLYGHPGDSVGSSCLRHTDQGMCKVVGPFCQKPGCKTAPMFNLPSEPDGKFCRAHCEPLMVNVVQPRCQSPRCKAIAVFGSAVDVMGRFCYEHRSSGMVQLRGDRCMIDGCQNRPSFAFDDDRPEKACADHAEPEMLCLDRPHCSDPKCDKYAVCCNVGSTQPLMCRQHASEDMIDPLQIYCQADGCKKQAYFCLDGEVCPRFCKAHSEDLMVRASVLLCSEAGCKVSASYGAPDRSGPRFCATHKNETMVEVHCAMCVEVGCFGRARFGFDGDKHPSCCITHRVDRMINMSYPLCQSDGCTEFAYYQDAEGARAFCKEHAASDAVRYGARFCDDPTCTQPARYCSADRMGPRYCADHKPPDMIAVSGISACQTDDCLKYACYGFRNEPRVRFCLDHRSVDMVNLHMKQCEEPGCNDVAKYNLPGFQPSFCTLHRPTNSVAKPRRLCIMKFCRGLATFGNGKVPIHCEKHAGPKEYDMLSQACIDCGLAGILDQDRRCETCNPEACLNGSRAKQNRVRLMLENHGYHPTTMDEMVDGGICHKLRPDFLFDVGVRMVILEVDENSHHSYPSECELARMFDISQSLGMQTIFIRFNPDDYTIDGVKQSVPVFERWQQLRDALDWAMGNFDEEVPFLTVKYLFYDDCVEQTFAIELVDGAASLVEIVKP